MKASERNQWREGLVYGLGAYGLWGLVPLYFVTIAHVSPMEILAHRVVWSLVFLALVVTVARRWPEILRVVQTPSLRKQLTFSALFIACNWFVYIYAATSKQVLQTSLGYFINPLFSVVLGLLVFREKLSKLQWAAVGMAAVSVGVLLLTVGRLPWIALTLAFSFGMYGLVRKQVPVDGLTGLMVETLVLAPVALGYLIYCHLTGILALGNRGITSDGLLLLAGVVTSLPLLCFGQAARRLPLSALGFLQYLSPSIQFVLAILVLGESATPETYATFGCIWVGLALFSLDSLRRYQGARRSAPLILPASAGEPSA